MKIKSKNSKHYEKYREGNGFFDILDIPKDRTSISQENSVNLKQSEGKYRKNLLVLRAMTIISLSLSVFSLFLVLSYVLRGNDDVPVSEVKQSMKAPTADASMTEQNDELIEPESEWEDGAYTRQDEIINNKMKWRLKNGK